MDIKETQKIAVELMTQHGLIAKGWKFGFDNAQRRLGRCSYRRQRISVSRNYASLNEEKLVRDTILHEIAHALTPNAGHGPVWKLKALSIGARPQSCKDIREVKFAETDWSAKCSDCGTVCPKYRRPRFDGRRHWHTPCARKANRGTILWFFRGQQYDDFGTPINIQPEKIAEFVEINLGLEKAAEGVKSWSEASKPTQMQINELWERMKKLEAKWNG